MTWAELFSERTLFLGFTEGTEAQSSKRERRSDLRLIKAF
jgi:hypothetical protein